MSSSVWLGPELEKTIQKLIEKGRYQSKSEVIREGIRLVEEREKQLALIDEALARGLADVEAGRVYPAEEVFAMWRKRLAVPDAAE
ncbi:MAG: type II toxin-antitoxin system ParD family antitoxin [Beijerinckiaceae bacterium]